MEKNKSAFTDMHLKNFIDAAHDRIDVLDKKIESLITQIQVIFWGGIILTLVIYWRF